MKGSWLSIVFAGLLLSGCGAGTPPPDANPGEQAGTAAAAAPGDVPAPAHERLLTVDDVARVTGFAGIHLVARNPAVGAGGELNFAREGEQLVLMARIQPASYFEQIRPMMAGAVAGVGDEAVEGPANGPMVTLAFRKGGHAVALSTYLDVPRPQPMLSQDQLKELAAIIEARL